MVLEWQSVNIESENPDISADIFVKSNGRAVKRIELVEGAKRIELDMPIGTLVDFEGVDDENDAIFLKVEADRKLPEICIVGDDGKEWCNYDIFKSGMPTSKIREILTNISDAMKIISSSSEDAKEYIKGILHKIKVVSSISKDEFGYAVSAYTEHHGEAPVCNIVIPEKWASEDNPLVLARILSHELGHCREAYHRRIRYLGPRNGEWKEVNGKVIPLGSERVAEHYSKRIIRKARI